MSKLRTLNNIYKKIILCYNYYGDTPSESTVKLKNYNDALDRLETKIKHNCKD